ncbi:putative Trimethyllysine dioxygenase [Triangularia setosa]|uniref:Trimethyllysine dioxygenase n=1 Tax=Triangularia setosa TaxID=2587417 RepID=A0AAN6WFE8_9PEZI|nr:putative Trimethyllysine dioxygenase [Podospora setosa]
MKSFRTLKPALLKRELLAASRGSFPRSFALCATTTTQRPKVNVRHYSSQNTAAIESDGLKVEISGGARKRESLPYFWLRDNCRCASCINQDTRQRNFDTFAIPSNIKPLNVSSTAEGVSVKWSDDHQSLYDWDFIQHYVEGDKRDRSVTHGLHYWGAEIAEQQPTVSFKDVMDSEKGVAELTAKIQNYGFSFIDSTPSSDPDLTRQVLERIAFIRLTHYGGFYDFIPDLAMADTAYTNIALPAHTDNTYFTDPSGLQAFHLLSHTPPPGVFAETAQGGASLLVDGFNAARILKKEDPKAFEILSKVRLPWHASGNAGITITPDRLYPVLELDEDSGELHRVRWNNDDRGVVPFGERYGPDEWYGAARKWDEILRRKESEFWVQLAPGRVLGMFAIRRRRGTWDTNIILKVFDNWRVMHGRSAFEGIRRICGAYINRDDWISRWRNTNFDRKKVLDSVIG